MKLSAFGVALTVLAAASTSPAAAQTVALKPVSAFSTIRDERVRSLALFEEAAKVLRSPRCMNCHPASRHPTQGNDLHAHVPPMNSGPSDRGASGLPCVSCHGPANTATLVTSISNIPGNANWRLAPASMAWQGKSLSEICLQLKDPARNGGRSLSKIQEHVARDSLVGWAWHPGEERQPAPGTQAQFGALMRAWIASGAQCPQP
jgi:hypothetical protein